MKLKYEKLDPTTEYGNSIPTTNGYSVGLGIVLVEDAYRILPKGTKVQIRSSASNDKVCWVVNPQQKRLDEYPVLEKEIVIED